MAMEQYVGISGVARQCTDWYVGISSVARHVKEGWVGISGVARQFLGGTPIGDFAVGTSVYLNVSGVSTEFVIGRQGRDTTQSYGEDIYDSSTDGTWIFMNENLPLSCYTDASNTSTSSYSDTYIHTYLNGGFLSTLDSSIQNIIKTVKIPYYYALSSTSGQEKLGANGLSTKVFLLAMIEYNYESSYNEGYGVSGEMNGTKLSYPPQNVVTYEWTRDFSFGRIYLCGTTSSGSKTYNSYAVSDALTVKQYIRPAMILPSDTLVNSSMSIIA